MKFNKLEYSKVVTTRHIIGHAWQVIDDSGVVVDVVNENGEKFILPTDENGIVLDNESRVIEEDAAVPFTYKPVGTTLGKLVAGMTLSEEQKAKIEAVIRGEV